MIWAFFRHRVLADTPLSAIEVSFLSDASLSTVLGGTNLLPPPLIQPWNSSVRTPIPLVCLFDSPPLLPEASNTPGTASGRYREHTAQGPVVGWTPK